MIKLLATIQEATRLYNQKKEAELERESKMATARMQADAFKISI